ncbi:coiled-coil domain-containing protein 81 isoform X1 [Hydra vulgaris]|uniref:coiled-coil domain-containing protein 81 isoform X1 n=1 Tax=Hydra vulgaris TaxID=6087 RepID=UPI001F5EC2BC|nr:coiled-coil domain-containing protein 81 [Hydra vulgaris]
MVYSPKRHVESIKQLIIIAFSNKNSIIKKLGLTPQEVFEIWDNVSQFVEHHLENKKAVKIPGLGVFTFTSVKLDVSQKKFILIQKPVFVISEKFAQNHKLSQVKYSIPGDIPVIPINYSALSHNLNISRDVVEASIKEVVNAFAHSIEYNPTCHLGFTTLGSILIHNNLVKMKFLPCFLEKIQQSVGLANIFFKRQTLHKDKFPYQLQNIIEDVYLENKQKKDIEDDIEGTSLLKDCPKIRDARIAMYFQNLPTIQQNLDVSTPCKSNAVFPTTPPKKAPHSKSVNFKNTLKNPIKAINFNKDSIEELKKVSDTQCGNCMKNMTDFCYFCYNHTKQNIDVNNANQMKKKEHEYDHIQQLIKHSRDSEVEKLEKHMNDRKVEEARLVAASNLENSEIARNEHKQKSHEFNRSFLFKDRLVTPPFHVKQADYGGALDIQVNERFQTMKNDHSKYKFLDTIERIQIADNYQQEQDNNYKVKNFKSEEYRKALDTQICMKKYLDTSSEFQEERKVSPKTTTLVPFQNHQEVNPSLLLQSPNPDSVQLFKFHGTNKILDMDENKLRKRRQNELLFKNQMKMAVERREKECAARMALRKEELEMLKRTRNDLLQESFIRNHFNVTQRLELEKSWCAHWKKKDVGEVDERIRNQSPGLLLHDQCEKYYKCSQCFRKPTNYGKSNVWSESRYVSGSRIML